MITADRIAALRRLCEAATPGPWVADIGNNGEADVWSQPIGRGTGAIFWPGDARDMFAATADAAFIAAARTALPELLDEAERLRGAVEAVRCWADNSAELITAVAGSPVDMQTMWRELRAALAAEERGR